MPVVPLAQEFRIRTEGTQPLLVFSDRGRSMGLAVDEIVDIVEDKLDIEVPGETPGSLGCAVVRGQATEVIDIGYFLPLAFQDWFRRNDAQGDKPVQPRPWHKESPTVSARRRDGGVRRRLRLAPDPLARTLWCQADSRCSWASGPPHHSPPAYGPTPPPAVGIVTTAGRPP